MRGPRLFLARWGCGGISRGVHEQHKQHEQEEALALSPSFVLFVDNTFSPLRGY